MKKLYLSIILFIFISQSSFSLNITWTGFTSNSWSDSSNFSPMVVPTQWDTVTIDNTANHPILSGNTRVYKLIMQGDTLDLNGYQMQTGNEGEFRGGVITGGSLKCSGTLAYFSGTVIDAEVIAACWGIQISGSIFHQKAYFENTGNVSSAGQGGNVFHDVVTIKNNSADEDFVMAGTYGDVFHDSLYVIINSAKNIQLAHTDTSTMKGCVRFQSTNYGSISMGKGGGVSIMEDNGHLAVESGDFYFGQLMLMNIQQTNTTGHRMVLTTSGMPDSHPLLILTDNYFKGETDFESPHILLKGNSFEANTILTKTGGNSDLSDGNNHFLANATITNTSTTGYFNLGGNKSDFYHGNVTFTSGSKPLIAGYKSYCYFYKNVEVNSSSVGISYAVWAGDTLQQMSGTHSQTYGRLVIDKPSEKVVAATPIDITGSVTFTSGHLETDSTNIITFLAGSDAMDASNNSFVSGPVKKVGDTAFEFPVGKGTYYSPVKVSAPQLITDSYCAEHFRELQSFGINKDSTLTSINPCYYWKVTKLSGTLNDTLSFFRDSLDCEWLTDRSLHITFWNDSIWEDIGEALEDDLFRMSNGTISVSGYYTFGNIPVPAGISQTTNSHDRSFLGFNGSNVIRKSGWDEADLLNGLRTNSRLYPGSIRYPGGTSGNWWDWRRGWFYEESTLPTGWELPQNYMNLDPTNPPIDNTLSQFKPYIDLLGSRNQLLLNMLSSDLPYQGGLIAETHRLNIPSFTIELGNEFYLDDQEHLDIFPDVTDYITKTLSWTTRLKILFGNNLKVGVVGATIRPNDPSFARRNNWLPQLVSVLNATNTDIDAIILHDYIGAGIGPLVFPQTDPVLAKDAYNKLFAHPFEHVASLRATQGEIGLIQNMSPTPEIWITEFNQFDRDINHKIHGTWAQGLAVSSLLLGYLEEPNITLVNLHTLVGNGVFSAMFDAVDGLDDFGAFTPPVSNPPTNPWEHTGLGTAIAPIAKTIKNTTLHTQLSFPGVPYLDVNNVYPGICGWSFEGPESFEVIILRMDFPVNGFPNEEINVVNLQIAFGNDYFVESWYQVDEFYDPIDYISEPEVLGHGIIGNATATGDENVIRHNQSTATQNDPMITLHPYSITKLVFPKSSPECSIIVSDNELCDGESTSIVVNGVDATSAVITFNATDCNCYESGTNTSTHDDEYTTIITCTNASSIAGTCEIIATTNSVSCTTYLTVYPELPAVTVTASATPGGSFYPVGSLILTAVPSGTVDHFIWIGEHNSESILNPYDDVTTVDVTSTTDFTLYYTNISSNQHCWGKADINIPVCAADAGPDRKICANQINDVALIGTPAVVGLTYSWTPSTDLDDDELAQPTASPSSTIVYTVTVSDGNGCTSTSEVTVQVLNDCCTGGINDYVTTGESTMWDLRQFFTGITCNNAATPLCTLNLNGTGQNIYINGDLTLNDLGGGVDPRMVFQNCNIYFAPEARIITSAQNKDLTFEACSLQRCSTTMWDGIYLANTADDLVVTDNTVVDGCKNCFVTSRGTRVTIEESTFTNFNRALVMENYDSPGATLITGNTFTGTDDLPLPFIDEGSLCGICLDQAADVNIGKSYLSGGTVIAPNIFEYSKYGIFSNKTNIRVMNNVFRHIRQPSQVSIPLRMAEPMQALSISENSSIAILAISEPINNPLIWPVNKAYIGESVLNSVSLNTFDECERGIEVAAISASIIGNDLTDCWHGIRAHNCRHKELEISGNTIEDTDFGINMFENEELSIAGSNFGNWKPSKVSNNTITVNTPWVCNTGTGHCTPSNVFGIRDAGNGIAYSMPEISGNIIETRGRYGILLQNTVNSLVKNNICTLSQGNASYIPGPFYGIRTENASGARIGCNNITGNGEGNIERKIAISSTYSNNLLIQCNETDETNIGLQFIADCDQSMVRGNSLNYHKYGFYLGDAGVNAPGVIGELSEFTNSGKVPGNLYQGDPGNPGDFPGGYALYRTHPIILANQDIFEVSPNQGGTYYTPSSSGANQTGNAINALPNNFDPVYTCSVNPCLNLLYDDGAEMNITNLESRIALISIEQESEIYDKYSLERTLFHSLKRNPELVSESEILSEFIDSLESTNHQTFYNLANISVELSNYSPSFDSAVFYTLVDNAQNLIASIVPVNGIEVNEKGIFDIYFRYFLTGNRNFNAIDSSFIDSVAFQCPYVGGAPVFMARGMYNHINDTIYFNDSLLCETIGSRIANAIHSNNYLFESWILLYPNPSDNFVKVSFYKANAFKKYRIVDAIGQMVEEKSICFDCQELVIDVTRFKSGVYFIVMNDENGYRELKKMVVLHE